MRCLYRNHYPLRDNVDWLLDPLLYEFMRQALAADVLMGILCPIVGTYLIVQRMVLLGDLVAYAVLPGLAISWST